MGKSTATSCFKIISCGGDSLEHDDLQTHQRKASTDRRGWSFRKTSSSPRVLSNTVITEADLSANKESPESTASNFQVEPNSNVPGKTFISQCTEQKTNLSAQTDSKLSGVIATAEDDRRADAAHDESSIILIQAAIRGYLARRVLLKQKNVIKLQAAVRGHLVRRHAVGTLRCVQAIVKMQTLVRARRARQPVEGSGDFQRPIESSGKDNLSPNLSGRNREAKPNVTFTYTSIEKLLSNKFARQLMESTSKTKHVNIKCDPSKSDSAWKWLERWMSVSLPSNEKPQESGLVTEQREKENFAHSDSKGDSLIQSEYYTESKDLMCALGRSDEISENDDDLISYDADNLDLHACSSISPSYSHSKRQNIDESNPSYDVAEPDPTEMKETDFISNVEVKSPPQKVGTGNKRDVSGKASNPSFTAALSKFEELSSASDDPGVRSIFGKVSSTTDPPLRSREIGLEDASISMASAVQIAGSECGTELSISSTLDSPDRSDAGGNDLKHEPEILNEADNARLSENLEFEGNGKSSTLGTELSYDNINQLERHESVDSAAGERVSVRPEADQDNVQLEQGFEASHGIVPESQVTPSSQASVKPKKSRGEKSESNHKNRSSSAGKRIISTPDRDSDTLSSVERKTRKRRNLLVSAKPDLVDQEPRDGSSSNSVPSYMQATESARAKLILNVSPRSSPDGQDKDICLKNRQSLHGTDGRQGSPRVHRSQSQAQQNAKANGVHSPQERKWRR